jgi:hypothetical protein
MPLTSRERSSPSPPAPPHFPALPIGLASCLAVTVVRLERLWHPPSTSDLAYMMAVHWYPERRQRLERALLDHYHTVLLENGVRSYNRLDMQDDIAGPCSGKQPRRCSRRG